MCLVRALLEMRVLFEGGPYMRKYGMHDGNNCKMLPILVELSQIGCAFLAGKSHTAPTIFSFP